MHLVFFLEQAWLYGTYGFSREVVGTGNRSVVVEEGGCNDFPEA